VLHHANGRHSGGSQLTCFELARQPVPPHVHAMDSSAPDFSHLTPLERIELAQQLWDSLPVSAHQPTEPVLDELRVRRAALEADGELGDPWDGESASRLLISLHPAADRARLAALLLASIEPTEPDIAVAWGEEIARRGAELAEGRLQAIPVADVFAALDQRLPR